MNDEQDGTGASRRCVRRTIDRIERGEACRVETMRKIVMTLGFTLEDKVFPY